MPRLTTNQRATLADWWNLAYDAGFGGFTTTDLISAASDIVRQAGISLSFQTSQDLAVLYGYARRMSNAADVVQSALDTATITADMKSIPPWARDEQILNTTPIHHVIFEFTYIDQAGVLTTDFRTSVFEMTFPGTIGDLKDAVTEDAQAMADKYGVQFQSINLLQIQMV